MNEQIHALTRTWDDAFNAGDMTRLAEFYAPEAGVVPAGSAPANGPQAIADFFIGLQEKGFRDHKIAVGSVLDKGDTIIATGKWQLAGPGEAGAVATYGGNWVNVFGRDGDGWRILLHTWN